MIIELDSPRTRYYFRAVCWSETLLIGVILKDGIWQLTEYFENPSGALILTLIKKNLLEGTAALYFYNEIRSNALDKPFI